MSHARRNSWVMRQLGRALPRAASQRLLSEQVTLAAICLKLRSARTRTSRRAVANSTVGPWPVSRVLLSRTPHRRPEVGYVDTPRARPAEATSDLDGDG